MNGNIKICHITSAHPQHDVRILIKECVSLSKHFDTSLIVVNGNEETYKNVNIINVDCGYTNRYKRFTKVVNAVFDKALQINADIYHIHDPELLRLTGKFKKRNKIVVYDAHEDLPRQIMSKAWINKNVRKLIANIAECYENRSAKKCDGIVAATPYIKQRFIKINKNTVNINNYPLKSELTKVKPDFGKSDNICYIGGISEIRGIRKVLESLKYLKNIRLLLAGEFLPASLKQELSANKYWNNVEYLGFVERDKIFEIMKNSFAGIVVFMPEPNHINSQPNKMFEYMAAGLPVVASGFELWKQVVEENNCGICVNPNDPKEIAEAIQFLYDNPQKAGEMGQNAQKTVLEKYNWSAEEKKLIEFYNDLVIH